MNTDQKTLRDARQYCPTLIQRKLEQENAMLVDVREEDEVAQLVFDVPNVIYLPMSEFEQRFAELPKDRELILSCSVGERSLKATYFLMYHGYEKVANMEDGLKKWIRKGFPVRGDIASITSARACCSPITSPSTSGSCC
ncbi:rhodanese-like domain-containing protein [Paludibacterium denitrificans]|uniref:Rhodanese-like domain-containing protein n=1 Tax=Paludibacterium denitrificans TaxID=2675226 RepID=A0A844GGV6_9NEIS|nr:rhodanese-like domain-containing protein [Paludibacterium denitrificans]MTD33735.1 rhodanese-like domain-containing protein [Paludibacterium denitrificans]